MARIGIAGSNGFIGSILKEELTTVGHDVVGITRNVCDLTNIDSVQSFLYSGNFDFVINCASVGGKETLGSKNYDELLTNIKIHNNLINNLSYRSRLINIGSGAEYDITTNIDNVSEWTAIDITPEDSYGLSKKIISNDFAKGDRNHISFRLFGCFHPTEPNFRLLKAFTTAIKNGNKFTLKNDRKFSWISGYDFAHIINEYITGQHKSTNSLYGTVNVAYEEQLYLSEFLKLYCQVNNIEYQFEIESSSNNHYTCNVEKLLWSFNYKYGLEKSLKLYG